MKINNCINCKQISYRVKKRDVNKIYSMIMEHQDSEYSLITRQVLCKAAFDVARTSNIKIRLSEDVSDEKSVKQHIWTLTKAGFPPAAALDAVRLMLKGEFKEAFWSLPGVSVFRTTSSIISLAEKALSMLPEPLKKDLLANDEVKYLLKLMVSLRDVADSNSLNEFYGNLKELLVASKQALLVFALIMVTLGSFCVGAAASVATALFTVGLAIAAVPIVGEVVWGVGLFIEAVCATIALGGGVTGFLMGIGSKKIPYEDVDQIDKAIGQETKHWAANIESAHKQKAAALAALDAKDAKDATDADEDTETPTEPLQRAAESQVRGDIISESLKARWQVIAGIKKDKRIK